jgi:hypothetical protein
VADVHHWVRFVTGGVNARTALPAVLELVRSGRLDPGVVTANTRRGPTPPRPGPRTATSWSLSAKRVSVGDRFRPGELGSGP